MKNMSKILIGAVLVASLGGCIYEDHGWHWWHHHPHPEPTVVYVHQ